MTVARLFGTDGIRGIAGREPITPETGLRLGRALARFLDRRNLNKEVVVGQDTRASGDMLAHAVASGVASGGGNALMAGVIPTPGVAFLARDRKAGAGVVISASHNPHEYNGFKLFSGQGFKLSEPEESEMEDLILSPESEMSAELPGSILNLPDTQDRYVAFLKQQVSPLNLHGMSVVLDCANGAAHKAAPTLFASLGARTEVLFADPDGRNINAGCGSQHTEALARKVVKGRAELGLAFDGDADRLTAVDEKGNTLTGDQVLVICARMLKEKQALSGNLVVSTVMSNVGLKSALGEAGIAWEATGVGDRLVVEAMRARGASLGGEESGHIVFLDHHTTGDGLLSALMVVKALKHFGRPLSVLADFMRVFPQVLLNVPVREKPEISKVRGISEAVEAAEKALGDRGRVLVRYSGTEPLCRIMVEGENAEEIKGHAADIAHAVKEAIGNP